MNCTQKIFLKFYLMTLTLCCLGCGGGGNVDGIELGTVSGKVTMDGKPLAHAVVVFKPAEGNPSSGQADSEGNYELKYMGKSKGAIIGSHTVTIIAGQAPSNSESSEEADMAGVEDIGTPDSDGQIIPSTLPPAKKEPIPEKYNTKTELKKEVASGHNTFDFELESK